MMQFGVISALPDILNGLQFGITGRAVKQGLITIDCWNPRDWATNTYRQIDDKPYGGGPGMVMMFEPLCKAIQAAKKTFQSKQIKTVYLSPQGRAIQQCDLNHIVEKKNPVLFIAGRYEGIDERIITQEVDEEWSLGDFVLSGGELAAMVFIDAMTRLIPGSLGHNLSAQQDSFMSGLLDHPHYTRPAEINGEKVPDVLLKGNHIDIERWRKKQALGATWKKRPELLEQKKLTEIERELLNEFIKEQPAE